VEVTDVTVVCVRTGACDSVANRDTNAITSAAVMNASGSGPSYP
jgi:hypothetical protein